MASVPNNSFQQFKQESNKNSKEYNTGTKKAIPCIIEEVYDRDYFDNNDIPAELYGAIASNASRVFCKVRIGTRYDFVPLGISAEEYYSIFAVLKEVPGVIIYSESNYDSRKVYIDSRRSKPLQSVNNSLLAFNVGI